MDWIILPYIGGVVGSIGFWGIFLRERPLREQWLPLTLFGMTIVASFILLLWMLDKGMGIQFPVQKEISSFEMMAMVPYAMGAVGLLVSGIAVFSRPSDGNGRLGAAVTGLLLTAVALVIIAL